MTKPALLLLRLGDLFADLFDKRSFYAFVFQVSNETHSIFRGFPERRLHLSLERLAQIKKESGVPPNALFLNHFFMGRMTIKRMKENVEWPYLLKDKADALTPSPEVTLDTEEGRQEFKSLRAAILSDPFTTSDYQNRRKLNLYIEALDDMGSKLAATQCRAFYGDEYGHGSCHFEDGAKRLVGVEEAINAEVDQVLLAHVNSHVRMIRAGSTDSLMLRDAANLLSDMVEQVQRSHMRYLNLLHRQSADEVSGD